MGVEVFLSGLIVLCLTGSNCTAVTGMNTAWVVKARRETVCGWPSPFYTDLFVSFKDQEFKYPEDICVKDGETVSCAIGEEFRKITLTADRSGTESVGSLKYLLKAGDVDKRFQSINKSALRDRVNVPTYFLFSGGAIGAGDRWPPDGTMRRWMRSNGKADAAGGALPGELTDRLKVAYADAGKVEFVDSSGYVILSLVSTGKVANANVTIQNRASQRPDPEQVGGFEDLAYLLWYNRLGDWTDTYCPAFGGGEKGAVLLRCAEVEEGKSCSCYDNCAAGNRFWPPVIAY